MNISFINYYIIITYFIEYYYHNYFITYYNTTTTPDKTYQHISEFTVISRKRRTTLLNIITYFEIFYIFTYFDQTQVTTKQVSTSLHILKSFTFSQVTTKQKGSPSFSLGTPLEKSETRDESDSYYIFVFVLCIT